MPRSSPRVLVVDDEPELVRVVGRAIHTARPEAEIVLETDSRRALHLVESSHWDLIVCDHRMPHVNGLSILRAARRRLARCRLVLMTGYSEIPAQPREMEEASPDALLHKPFRMQELVSLLDRLLSGASSTSAAPSLGRRDAKRGESGERHP